MIEGTEEDDGVFLGEVDYLRHRARQRMALQIDAFRTNEHDALIMCNDEFACKEPQTKREESESGGSTAWLGCCGAIPLCVHCITIPWVGMPICHNNLPVAAPAAAPAPA